MGALKDYAIEIQESWEFLRDSWINGHRKDVTKGIATMPKRKLMAIILVAIEERSLQVLSEILDHCVMNQSR